jgi:hypothetical protein
MAISAKSVIASVARDLKDLEMVRWTLVELIDYLNAGQREIVAVRPDMSAKIKTVALVQGSLQTIPADTARLMRMLNNADGNKRAIRIINMELMDAYEPTWRNRTPVGEVIHYSYDTTNNDVFEVYPPAKLGTNVVGEFETKPSAVAAPESGLLNDVTGDIWVPDMAENALQHYMMARAYSKDAEYANNTTLAAGHKAEMANALGIELSSGLQNSPTDRGAQNSTVITSGKR